MSTLTLIGIALGLSMDAFAVSVTSGAILKERMTSKVLLKIGALFGFFQAVMPLLGWLLGQAFSEYIHQYDHWIAFFLLLFIGAKMIYEAQKKEESCFDPLNPHTLFLLAVATSVDALAIGVSMAFLETSILPAILLIGLITFLMSEAGILIGKKGGEFLKEKAELAGGIVLILIGTKILFEHLGMFFK